MSTTLGYRLLTCVTLALVSASVLSSQEGPPVCPAAEVHRFDFLVGNWRGREYLITGPKDSTLDDALVAQNRKLPFGCALEERWTFTPRRGSAIRSVILRAYDLASKSWKYSLVNSFGELVTFQAVPTESGWTFLYDEATGPHPHRLRIEWVPMPTGYTEIIHVSTDSGKTWPVLRHMNYTRDSSR